MVVKKRPTAQTIDLEPPKTQADFIETAVVEDRRVHLNSVMPYVSGLSWTVTYYKSVLGKDNNVRELDIEESGATQQFEKIEELEIKVQTELIPGFNNEKGTTSVTGSSLIYGFFTPNVNDYFTATTDTNDVALIRVYQVERKTHRNGSVWEISYNVVGYLNNQDVKAMMESLTTKVVETYFFHKERLVRGTQPMLRKEEHVAVLNLDDALYELSRFYVSTFRNPTVGTFTLPSMIEATYDHGLVEFFLGVTDTRDNPGRDEINLFSHCNDKYILQPTIWTALKERNPHVLSYCNNKFGRVSTRMFSRNIYFRELYFSSLEYVMYPRDPDLSVQARYQEPKQAGFSTVTSSCGCGSSETSTVTDVILPGTGFKGAVLDETENSFKGVKLFPGFLDDDYHVFSEGFYKNQDNLTHFETQVMLYLRKESLDLQVLYKLIEVYRKLNRLEQFYFGPILILLIRVAIDERY